MAVYFNVMPTGTLDNLWAAANGIYEMTTPVWTYLFVALGGFLALIILVKLLKHK